MSRCMTAAQIKGKWAMPVSDKPREGSHIREVYDLFQAKRGQPVEFMQAGRDSTIIAQLQNFWGLDIRKVEQGNKRTGRKSKYILAGEWFGRVYVDYVAERMEAAQ